MPKSQTITIDPSDKKYVRVGLSWDATEKDYQKAFVGEFSSVKSPFITMGISLDLAIAKIKDKAQRVEELLARLKQQKQVYRRDMPSHNLDLLCFCYDKNNEVIDFIAPIHGNEININTSIWASSDDEDGVGVFDDEDITVNLQQVPADVQSIFWVVDSGDHNFADVKGDSVRVIDTSLEQDYFRHDLADDLGEDGNDKKTFIFSSLMREGENWILREISEYIDVNSGGSLHETLSHIIRQNYLS